MDQFSLKEVSITEIEKELRELNSNKATTFGYIRTKIIKQSSKSCFDTLLKLFNELIMRDGKFPGKVKCAGVPPVFEKDDPTKHDDPRILDE